MASYKESEDLINVGAYAAGSNPKVDKAIIVYDDIMNMLKQMQGMNSAYTIEELFDQMVEIARKAEGASNSEVIGDN
jgi:flagellum-specific ATP synthase